MLLSLVALVAFALVPADETIRLDVSRDTWLSGVGAEADGSNGASPRLKLKSHQEFTLLDVEVPAERFKGRIIRAAQLHVKSSGEPRLKRVTVAGLASPFHEGTATNYAVQKGASTFRRLDHPDVPWAGEGDICNVLFGPFGALWKTADASKPDKEGWQTIAVDPRVMAARFAGLTGGFTVFDDTGTEWTRDGDTFHRTLFPNRYIYGKDQNRSSAPYFTVVLGDRDNQAPQKVGDLQIDPETKDRPEGEAIVSWTTPIDRGAAGTLGFVAEFEGKRLDLASIPIAGDVGSKIRITTRGGAGTLTVWAVDSAGNVGEVASIAIEPSKRNAHPLAIGLGRPGRPGPNVKLPRLGNAEISIIDELDKVDPVRGTMIPEPIMGRPYLLSNSLFDASLPRIRMSAARGEAVAFQILVMGQADALTAKVEFDEKSPATVQIGQYVNVMTRNGPMPDPIVPITGPIRVPEKGLTSASLHVEFQVQRDASPGFHTGKLIIESGKDRLVLPMKLMLHRFALPDHLSFLPEMNCYGLGDDERDYYRLAHLHRTVLNRVPYSHNGRVHDGCAPKWDGKSLDWTEWDKRFGPLFDGSAFADLPRTNVPIDLFYLPLFENWPTAVEGNYNGDFWADRAFSKKHSEAFVEASRQIAAHIRSKGWDDTIFECFFNGKNDFKLKGWSRATSPWLLDEPANFQDYWALRHFGGLFHEGINAAPPGKAKLMFRADISRPQWQRNELDDVLDVNVVGGAVREYRSMVLDRKSRLGHVVIEYGGSNPIESSNVQPAAWCIDAWAMGLDGVLPWQTVGNAESWTKADELSLFYPGKDGGPPVPSIRLKAFRRGQQDVEYLTLLAKATGEPRWSIARSVRETLKASAERRASGNAAAEDAGRLDYGKLMPMTLNSLRSSVGSLLDERRIEGGGKVVDFRTPKRSPRPMSENVAK